MAKSTTSQKSKNDVVDNKKGASTKEAPKTGKTPAVNNKTDDGTETSENTQESKETSQNDTPTDDKNAAVEGANSDEGKTDDGTETSENATEKGLPFTVGDDGLVEVVATERAGTSVYGTTGEVVTFDENGHTRVCIDEALHFAKMPGFKFEK